MKFEFDVDDSVARVRFPPMLLLTLVENAVKHGIGPAAEGGRIHIMAHRARGALQISVADDGVGLKSVLPSGTGVGLANIRRQLSARYGRRASFSLAEQATGGVLATITVPIIEAASSSDTGAMNVADSRGPEHA